MAVLNDVKKGEIVALVSAGCSRLVAAAYVGCAPSTITYAAQHDPDFAKRLREVGAGLQVRCLKRILKAADQEQYWRAAAWMLERLNPEDFSPRKPHTFTGDQVGKLLDQLAQILIDAIPEARLREPVVARVNSLVAGLLEAPKATECDR